MESLSNGVFGFRSRADVEAYVTQMNEDAKHSVSWVRDVPAKDLADVALTVEDEMDRTSDPTRLALLRERRRIVLDELVRRGLLKPYTLV